MKNQVVAIENSHIDTLPVTEWEDGVARVRDTDLGKWLGYKEPRQIRRLVNNHLDNLQEFGLVAYHTSTQVRKNGATHEIDVYDLNRDQAVYITSQAGTPKARALTVYVVKVFGTYLDGKLVARTAEINCSASERI